MASIFYGVVSAALWTRERERLTDPTVQAAARALAATLWSSTALQLLVAAQSLWGKAHAGGTTVLVAALAVAAAGAGGCVSAASVIGAYQVGEADPQVTSDQFAAGNAAGWCAAWLALRVVYPSGIPHVL